MLSVKKSRWWGNLDRAEEADGILSDAFQLSSTREGKVGSVSHICSNWKGLGDFCSKGSVISKMGQWLDLTLGRWYTSAAGKRIFHSAFPKPLSNHSLILHGQIGILLVHVNRGPWKPRSMSPNLSMKFLNADILFLFNGKPPIFSSSKIISLKSPNRTQGKDTTLARFCK